MSNKEYLENWANSYHQSLTTDILPFWLEHGLDKVHGGVYTCLDRYGTIMDTTKSVWFQGRFAYVCALAYNTIAKEKSWLDAAKSTLDFIDQHCFDEVGHMYFSVTADGRPIRKRRYVFSESFAAIAFAEYALASGEKMYAYRALEIFRNMKRFLSDPAVLAPKFEQDIEWRGHSIVMIMMNVASVLQQVLDEPELEEQIQSSIHQIRAFFVHPEYQCLLETVDKNGEFINSNIGRTINPGHCIETSWFLMDIARKRNWNQEILHLALTIFDWSWEWGWDQQYGGIINFRDCLNMPPQDYSQDMKFWWPQCETIIASLYAYLATGEEKYLQRHKQISDWTYDHFPDKLFGEWYGYLHRDGSVAQDAKGNLYKGPFHIPRMLIKSYQLTQDIIHK